MPAASPRPRSASTARSASLGYGVAPLPSGAVRDGEVADPDALGDAIKALFAEHKFPREVRIGIANQKVAVRSIRLPRIENRDELEAAIRFSAQDHIPMPLDRAVLDWQVIPTVNGERRHQRRRRRGRRAPRDALRDHRGDAPRRRCDWSASTTPALP